jgi:uncharacterized membrane protein
MLYAFPIALIAAAIAVFFAVAHGRFREFPPLQSWLRALAALPLFASAAIHFARPSVLAAMIPPVFPDRFALVILSGIFEIAGAIGLFLPKVRRTASLCIAVLMVAVFPANIHVAGRAVGGLPMPGVAERTAMQVVYVVLILLVGWGLPGRGMRRAA